METQSQQPIEEAPQEEVVLPVEDANVIPRPVEDEEEDADDISPLTVDEFKDTARQVVTTVKDGVLIPVYRIGRRWLRGAEGAADEFFGGATGDKRGKR